MVPTNGPDDKRAVNLGLRTIKASTLNATFTNVLIFNLIIKLYFIKKEIFIRFF